MIPIRLYSVHDVYKPDATRMDSGLHLNEETDQAVYRLVMFMRRAWGITEVNARNYAVVTYIKAESQYQEHTYEISGLLYGRPLVYTRPRPRRMPSGRLNLYGSRTLTFLGQVSV